MKRKFRQLFLTLLCAISLHAGAQEVTYIHEHDIMSQFTTMETGAGSLSPAWYYNTFHKSYQSDANARNKLAYRTEVMGYTTLEQDLAEKVDSDYTKRAEVEAINIVSRSSASDLSWVLEKSKLDGKMDVFNKNINNIVSYGGSPNDYQSWRISITALRVPSRLPMSPIKTWVSERRSTSPSTRMLPREILP